MITDKTCWLDCSQTILTPTPDDNNTRRKIHDYISSLALYQMSQKLASKHTPGCFSEIVAHS